MPRKKNRFSPDEMIRIAPEAMPGSAMANTVRLTNAYFTVTPPRWSGMSTMIDSHLFVVIERGTMAAIVDDDTVELPAGSVCWIPPGTNRRLCSASAMPVRNWRLRFSVHKDGHQVGLNGPSMVRGDGHSLLPHLQILSEVASNRRFADEARPLLSAFLLRFLALPEISEAATRQLDAVQKRQVERLVKRGLLVGVTPREMADEAGLSADYFTRLFKATYGIPPRRYLLEKRMELAGRILRDSTLSVKEVCVELGEPDVGTFCRLFKRVMGTTPTHYRRR